MKVYVVITEIDNDVDLEIFKSSESAFEYVKTLVETDFIDEIFEEHDVSGFPNILYSAENDFGYVYIRIIEKEIK